mgnify:CR=1 FL=1
MKKITEIISGRRSFSERFIPNFDELKEVVERLKDEGKTIVLISGVYDLIHIGHARFLEMGKQKGDILIVGVDSDELTKKRKGPSRPLVPEDERIEMLSHLRHVDIITLYKPGQDNFECIEKIQPHKIIISETTKDIKPEMLEQIEKYKIEKILLSAQAKVSTTERYRQITMDGGKELGEKVITVIQNHLNLKDDGKT